MSSKKIFRILDKEVPNKAKNELSFLFRSACRHLGIDLNKWEFLTNEYLSRFTRRPLNPKKRSHERGNILSQLTDDDMTWKVFMRAVRWLNPTYMKLTIEFGWNNPARPKTIHHLNVPIRSGMDGFSAVDEITAA